MSTCFFLPALLLAIVFAGVAVQSCDGFPEQQNMALVDKAATRMRNFTSVTMAELVQSGLGPLDNLFDDPMKFDYDILALLMREVGLIHLLEIGYPKGLTFTGVDDAAFFTTAQDISKVLGDPEPRSEHDAYVIVKAFFARFENPLEVLRHVLLYHFLPGRHGNLAFSNKFSLKTLSGVNVVLKDNHWLSTPHYKLGFWSHHNFYFPMVYYQPSEIMNCKNGIIQNIQRLNFPYMHEFKVKHPFKKKSTFVLPTPSHSPQPSASSSPSYLPIPANDSSDATSPLIPDQSPGSTSQSPPTGVVAPDSTSTEPAPSFSSETETENSERGACFPGSVEVLLPSGKRIRMSNLSAGQVVKVSSRRTSPIFLFTHKQKAATVDFVELKTMSGHNITLTPGHFLYVNGHLRAAKDVSVGDILQTLEGASHVISAEKTVEKGLYAPHTLQGDIIVNGILASTYTTALRPMIAHTLLWPFRAIARSSVLDEPIGSFLYDGWPRI